jgi:hypothetical protein
VRAVAAGDGAIHDRQREPSDDRRAIGGQRRAGSQRQGAIQARDGRSSVVHEVIRVWCEAQRVAHRAIGEQLRVDVNSTERSGRKTRSQASIAEQSANGARREGKSEEQSELGTEREGWARSNPGSTQGRSKEPGAIQARSGKPSVEHEAIRERGEALKC